jgi:molybdopterin-guanine dinucleotide biosynthesis protein A
VTAARERLAGAILAGGGATRLGGLAKGALDVGDGRTMARRALDALTAAGIEDVIVCAAAAAAYGQLGCAVVPDLRPGAGPLGGIEAALAHYAGRCDAVVLLPCDTPGIGAAEVRALAAAFRASGAPVVAAAGPDGRWHPLCAVLRNGILGRVSEALDAGRAGVGDLWRALGAKPVRFDDETPFVNVNTPEDLHRWRELERNRGG